MGDGINFVSPYATALATYDVGLGSSGEQVFLGNASNLGTTPDFTADHPNTMKSGIFPNIMY